MKQVNDRTVRRADPSGVARQGHTLAEVAEAYLPPSWTDGARWLSRRLNAGKLTGYKCGRTWMMRDSDIEYMLSTLANDDKVVESEPERHAAEPMVMSFSEALSPRSRAKLQKLGT
jgi:hypothetical protein